MTSIIFINKSRRKYSDIKKLEMFQQGLNDTCIKVMMNFVSRLICKGIVLMKTTVKVLTYLIGWVPVLQHDNAINSLKSCFPCLFWQDGNVSCSIFWSVQKVSPRGVNEMGDYCHFQFMRHSCTFPLIAATWALSGVIDKSNHNICKVYEFNRFVYSGLLCNWNEVMPQRPWINNVW